MTWLYPSFCIGITSFNSSGASHFMQTKTGFWTSNSWPVGDAKADTVQTLNTEINNSPPHPQTFGVAFLKSTWT
jgi:hypothetical protein